MKSSDQIIIDDVERAIADIDLSSFKNARVLLSGASGLLGAYFAYLFYYLNTSKGYGVQADFITRNPINENSFLYKISRSEGFSFVAKDLSEPATYEGAYDFMIHAAGYGSPVRFIEDPIKTINVNFIGIKSMLEHAARTNPKCKVLYFSSSEIYGSPSAANIPTPETYVGNGAITSNRACYTESKRLSEVLCLAHVAQYGMHVRIVRPALTYGPALTFLSGRVIGEFMKKAYLTKTIDMKDDGSDLRSYCYIGDALRQLLVVLLFSEDTIYNIGSAKEEVSIKQLAEKIGALMDAKVVVGPGKDVAVLAAPSRVCLDMTKVKKEFGVEAEVSLGEGLKRMIDWNRALINENIIKL